MGILIKKTNEYVHIRDENSFENEDGIYLGTGWFQNQSEREKEKQYLLDINNFLTNLKNILNSLNEEEYNTIFICLNYFENNYTNFIYDFPNWEEQPREEIVKFLEPLEKYGFNKEWILNPILKESEQSIWVAPQTQTLSRTANIRTKSDEYSMLKNFLNEVYNYNDIEDC